MEAHKGHTSSKASPPNQTIQQVRPSVSTGNLPWTLSKVGEGPTTMQSWGTGNVFQRGQPWSSPCGGKRDEGRNSGWLQHEEVLR